MKKLTDEQIAWLQSSSAKMLRKHYEAKKTIEHEALIASAMISSDPSVRSHATAYTVWKLALKELEITNESDN